VFSFVLVERRRIVLGAEERAIEPEAALEDRRRPAESAAREAGRDDTGVRRPSRMNSFHPRAALELLADSRGEAAGDTERRGEPIAVEGVEPAGRDRRAERAAHRRRVPA